MRRVGELCSCPSTAMWLSIRFQKNHQTGEPVIIKVTATKSVFRELVVETSSPGVMLSSAATSTIIKPAAAAIRLIPETMYSYTRRISLRALSMIVRPSRCTIARSSTSLISLLLINWAWYHHTPIPTRALPRAPIESLKCCDAELLKVSPKNQTRKSYIMTLVEAINAMNPPAMPASIT